MVNKGELNEAICVTITVNERCKSLKMGPHVTGNALGLGLP